MTQERLAEALSVSVGYISQIERGVTKINLDTLAAVAAHLNCELSELVTGVSVLQGRYLEGELAQLVDQMDGRQRKMLLEVAKSIPWPSEKANKIPGRTPCGPVFIVLQWADRSALLLQKGLLDVPELLRQVHVVVMGILKALNLVPQQVDPSGAVGPHLGDGGGVVYPPAPQEDGSEQLLGGEVGDTAALPGGVGVKELQGLALVHRLVVEGDEVGESLAALLVEQAVHLLEVGVGDLYPGWR